MCCNVNRGGRPDDDDDDDAAEVVARVADVNFRKWPAATSVRSPLGGPARRQSGP